MPDATIKDVLTKIEATGVKVDIILRNAKTYQGTVESVGHHNVRLKQTGSRSFYDAFIKIEDISAVEVQVQNL